MKTHLIRAISLTAAFLIVTVIAPLGIGPSRSKVHDQHTRLRQWCERKVKKSWFQGDSLFRSVYFHHGGAYFRPQHNVNLDALSKTRGTLQVLQVDDHASPKLRQRAAEALTWVSNQPNVPQQP